MNILLSLIGLYITAGIIYTVFLLTQRSISFLSIPINILGGPILFIHYVIKYYFKKDTHPANIRHKDILKGKKAVFFDLDGTIWDSSAAWIKAIEKTAEENGFISPNVIETFVPGTGLRKIWKDLLNNNGYKLPKNKDIKILAKETEQNLIKEIKNTEHPALVEGFRELVFYFKDTKGFKVALVTNSSKEVVTVITEKTDVAYIFDLILTGDDVSSKKPSPEIFNKAARKLHVSPKEVLVFEDSLPGSKAAAKAGMDQIIIWRTDEPTIHYHGNIYGFYPDFVDLDKIIDQTSQQRVLEGIKSFRKSRGLSEDENTEGQGEGEQETQTDGTEKPNQ